MNYKLLMTQFGVTYNDQMDQYMSVYLLTFLLCDATVLVELWPPHIFYVRFRDSKFLQDGVVSPTPNPQLGEPGYLY
jgi:hypothetical protein